MTLKTWRPLLAAGAAFLCATAGCAAEPLSPVRLNQLGLLAKGAKLAVLPHPSRQPLRWQLVDQAGRVRASGMTSVFGNDTASGEHLHRVDLGGFAQPGSGYRVVVADRRSRPFAIGANIYDRLQYDALNYFYQSRAGTPIEERYAGGAQWARPAGHPNERVRCVSGKDAEGNEWPGCDYELDVTGGWYDAGDHGKYVVNGGISLWTLLNLYERQLHLKRASAFADGKAALPERGNGVNDLLDEARWQMEFMLRMQVPEGKSAMVPVGVKRSAPGLRFTRIDASGMAHHKVADEKWTALPMAPHLDPERRILFPPSTSATLNLAATAAQCARIWRGIDDAFAARCLAAAERAWQAARRNPEVYAIAGFTGSGGYGDANLADEFYWAAAELYAATGKRDHEQAVRAAPAFGAAQAADFGWPSVATLGTISLALVRGRLPQADVRRLRSSLVAAAGSWLQEASRVGYRIPYAQPNYPWGSNSSILNRAMVLGLAHDWTGEARYRDGVIDAMDYVLGRNPLDQSYVSGYGARPMLNPHHRFWARQADAKFPPPPPGAVSGGPNNSSMSDDIARPMKGKCAAQTCWKDDIGAFSLNEVAINWNAPLVWVAAWLDEPR